MNLQEKKDAYGKKRREAIANNDKQGERYYDLKLATLEDIDDDQ